jgi:hypothetical protein
VCQIQDSRSAARKFNFNSLIIIFRFVSSTFNALRHLSEQCDLLETDSCSPHSEMNRHNRFLHIAAMRRHLVAKRQTGNIQHGTPPQNIETCTYATSNNVLLFLPSNLNKSPVKKYIQRIRNNFSKILTWLIDFKSQHIESQRKHNALDWSFRLSDFSDTTVSPITFPPSVRLVRRPDTRSNAKSDED